MDRRSDGSNLLAQLREGLDREGIEDISTLLILGSGMSDILRAERCTPLYERSAIGVEGHDGRIVLWHASTGPLLVSLGRRHLYEGSSSWDVRRVVDVAAELGARLLVTTNAAGGLNPRLSTGDLMLITDYLGMNLARYIARQPLENSTNHERHPRREPFAVDLYDDIERRAMEQGVALLRGVYAGVTGPSYETRAEIRMLRRMGADAVGMSTIPEVIAAADNGMRTVGLSLITNVASDVAQQVLEHVHVVQESQRAERKLRTTIEGIINN